MRFLIDAQLPPALSDWFREQGHDAEHVRDVMSGQTPDHTIADYVEQHGIVLVTKDDDFLLRHPPIRSRLLWLRCGNITNRALRDWLGERWPAIKRHLDDGDLIVEVQ